MQHSFDVDIAKEYGILEAILLNNIWFWIEKNRANNTNYYDGYYWTYNSTRAFNELFPYVSQRQIQNALKKLIDNEILQTGNYNKIAYDRTLWYAFTEKGKCIMQKCKMESPILSNGNGENGQPIPNNKPDAKPNNKPDTNTKVDPNVPYEIIKNLFHNICISYPKLVKVSDTRKTSIAARYKEYDCDIEVFKTLFTKAQQSDFLKGNNDRSWKANFDWLMNQSNMAKVLEDKYKNKEVTNGSSTNQPNQQSGSKYAQFS